MNLSIRSQEFEDTKGEIRICKSKKNRQNNDQIKKYKRTNNYLQNITQITEVRVTWTHLKPEVISGAPEG